jgi:hypothetical protein
VLSILGAPFIRSVLARVTIEAATAKDIVFLFLKHYPCPRGRPVDGLLADFVSAKKVDGVPNGGDLPPIRQI